MQTMDLSQETPKALVIHNTLATSDYGLLDQKTFEPRPNYWGALLWRRLMGTTVLDSGVEIAEERHVYAHCLRGSSGGVTLLVINNSRTETAIEVPLRKQALHVVGCAAPERRRRIERGGAQGRRRRQSSADRGSGDRCGIRIVCARHDHVSDGRAVRKFRLRRFVNRRWMISGTSVGRAGADFVPRPTVDGTGNRFAKVSDRGRIRAGCLKNTSTASEG
ncbi:hypothetical protein FHR88_006592 [Bradyrhizobium betae]|nr:hypothetical protein [Bradyrhizobium betae]